MAGASAPHAFRLNATEAGHTPVPGAAGEPETAPHPVDLGQVSGRVVGRHRPIAQHRAIEVELAVPEEPLRVHGDVTLIEQALSVIDDGPGVPEEQLSRLAERYFRGDAARSRRPEGRGLGLHITQEVARRHGFDLRIARSAEGGLDVELAGRAILTRSRRSRLRKRWRPPGASPGMKASLLALPREET